MTDTLVTKIAKAGQSVGGKLKADKTNVEQRYDYISADQILSVCGQALFEQGVVVIPEADALNVSTVSYTNSRGQEKSRYDATVEFVMTITDGDKSIEARWSGMGSDYAVPDKALYKAMTSGHKYFLMKLLNVGEGNPDSEHEPAEDTQASSSNGNKNGTPPEISPETVKTVKNSEDVLYVDLDSEVLAHMATALQKHVNDKTATDEHKLKLAAARAILADRNK